MKIGQLVKDMKLSKKLLISPMVVIVFLILLGWVSYRGLISQKEAMEDVFQNRFKNYQISAALVNDLATMHSNLYKLISWANANYEEKKIQSLGKEQINMLEKAARGVSEVQSKNELAREEKVLLGTIGTQLAEYKKVALSAIDLATSDLNMATMYMGNADDKYQVLYKTLQELLALENKLSQESYISSMASYSTAVRMFFIIMGISLIISIGISLLTARKITHPLHQAMKVIHQIAEGDLTRELKVESRDEVGELAKSVEMMRLKMSEAVGQSVSMSQSLAEAAAEQAASLEETSSSLEEMTSMTKQNAGNAHQANSLMDNTQEVIKKADGSMRQLIASMREISTASEETVKIIKTIDEIAFQTNLLALNAAVEAARAGEAGAGFAVVADEVRNLAMRAAEAAKNTSELMADIMRKIKNGEKLVNVTAEGFRELTDSSSKVVGLIQEIAAASQEQAQGIEQINKAVTEMNNLTQKNAAAAEELASLMAIFKTNGSGGKSTGAISVSPKADFMDHISPKRLSEDKVISPNLTEAQI
ncbi:MAG: methyl-accepting chemotaxis protein [Thermodesulfobacteriota bacterium]